MVKMICLDNKFSTTKRLTTEIPVLKKNSNYRFQSQFFLPINITRKEEGGLRSKEFFKKSDENRPLISVVTVVRNGEKYLEQTIKSVLTQTYDNVEYIIIDGASTDNTLAFINKYNEQIDYWISEPDSGIYHAMNKGICLSTGEYIAFLNADDWYNQDTINDVVAQINNNKQIDYVFGNVNIYSGNKLVDLFTQSIDDYKNNMPFPHPTLFTRHSILLEEGFDESYKIIADYDFIIKLIEKHTQYYYIDKVLTNFRKGGISSISSYERELFQVTYLHFGLLAAIKKYYVRNLKYDVLFPVRIRKKIINAIRSFF
jgi:glycosyltransferase involved in cell wall biosynthesis